MWWAQVVEVCRLGGDFHFQRNKTKWKIETELTLQTLSLHYVLFSFMLLLFISHFGCCLEVQTAGVCLVSCVVAFVLKS